MNKSSPGRPYLTMRSLCLSLLVGAILPSSSLGYPGPNDPKRWPGNSITYNIDPVSFPVNSNRETLILNALYGWDYETFAGTSFGTYYWAPPYGRTADNNNDTTNTIGFTSNISDIQVLAVTSWRANASNQYLEADIAINRFVNWDSPALPDSGPPYNVFSLENVVRHEAGHGAGFRGEESRKPRVATMNPVYSWGGSAYSNLHGDDRNGLRTFYPTSGDDHDVRVMGWALDDFGQTDTVPAPHPQYLSSKQNITVTYTVENLGTVSYQDSLDFYLSIFPNIDPSFDTKIGTTAVSLPAAKGGDAIVPILTTSRTVTIPCGVSGTNYIGAFARYPSDDNTGDNVSVFQTQEHPYPLAITDLSPDEPILVSATTELCDRVHITWQDVSSDETGFRIYRNSQHIGTALANASSFDDFPAAGTYTYGVTAVNTVCESDTGKAAGIRRTAPTAAPTSITGTSNRCDGILVAWAWGSSSPAGFKVYRDTETLPVYTGTTPSETNWLDSGASPGGHSYQVAAYNSCGTGPKSSSASGQRLTPSSTVATPSSTSDRCDGILVEWLWGGSGQTAFYVFRDNAGTPTFTAVATARTWLDTSASPGSHEYTIQAIYAGNCFGPVSSITTGVRLGPPTSSPSFLTATDYLCNVVALAWNYSGSNHSGFQVLRNGTQITAIADPGARSYDDATAVQGVTYSYKVHAYNGCGPGADSNQDAGTRQSSPPAQTPSSVAASDGGFCCTQTLVTWGWASDGHQGFRVLRDGVTIFSGTDANQRQWADVGGSAGVTYSYSVLAYNGCGNGPVSSGDPGTRCSPTFFGPNPISVATVGPDAGYKESIVPDGSGGVIVAWSDKRNGTDYNVYAQHVNSAGTICWTTGGVPVETAPGDQVNVDMVSDGFGGAFLVWEDGRKGLSNSDVRYRHITLTGTLAPVALGGVVCGAPGNQLGPRVTSDGAHGAIVVWQDTRDTNYDIYGQRIHGGSYPVWAFDTLGVAISTATDNEYFPQVVPDGSGGAYMTWVNEFSFGNSDIFAQRVDQAGVLQWSPSLRLTQGTWTIGGGYPPFDTKTNSTGDLLVGWTQYQGGSPSGGDIRAQKVSPGGVLAWGTNGIGVGTGPESQVVQRIQPDATGGFAIVWKAERGAAADIYAQHLDTSGHKLWLHDGVRLATGSVPQEDNLYILPWGASEWAVMWRQQATESVYAARVNSVGEPIGPVYGTAVGAEVATLGSFTPVADGTGQVIFAYQTCCGMRPLNVNRLVLPSTGAPDVAQSFFVPQSGSVASPTEGQVAVRLMRVCPNNDGGSSLPNNVRVKVVLKDGAGAPLAGIDPADIFVALNGGTAAQGFYGAGADSIIANNAYNPTTDCPNLTMIVADAPTDANGVTYITFTGATPGSPGVGTRDPLRKWGHYDSELPVYALGRKLEGRLTSTSANGTYVLQIKNVDWTGGLGPALDQGEVVTVSDFNGISNGQGINNQISFWKDLNWLNGVDTIDRNIITAHFSDTGQHDCRTPNDP